MKYKISFYGNVIIETTDEESAISQAIEFINENAKDYCEVKEVE